MGNIWWEKILANHTGKSYWWGKIWQISYSQCICQIHFWCICEYWQGKFWRITHDLPNSPIFSPAKYFLCIRSLHLCIVENFLWILKTANLLLSSCYNNNLHDASEWVLAGMWHTVLVPEPPKLIVFSYMCTIII